MRIAGIDPGKSGAIVTIDSETLEVGEVLLMPYDGKELDVATIKAFLGAHADAVVLERQHAMPAQGRSSIFTLGSCFGALRATCVCVGLRYVTPLPSAWTKKALAGVPGLGKARNVAAARRLFPSLDLTPGRRTKPHDGIADGALLAYYGLLTFCGRNQ